MKLKIDEIKKELEEQKWELISTSYSNLDEPLEVKCPMGHTVYSSYKKLRKKFECPVCANNELYNVSEKTVAKPKGTRRIIALDQATQTTGYSIFDGDKLIKYGTFKAKGAEEIERDASVKEWLLSLIAEWKPDCVGIEGVQLQSGGPTIANQEIGVTTLITLARLQGILMLTCAEQKIDYKVCHTATWREHCKVKGRTRTDKKRSMQLLVEQWYQIKVSEDEADAIGIGRYVSETYNKNFEIISWE